MRVSPATALIVLLLAGLTACTGDEDTRPSPSQPTRTQAPSAASSGHKPPAGMSFTVGATVHRTDAVPASRPEPRPYDHPYRSVSDLGDGRYAAGLGLTDDGRLITSSDPRARTVDGELRIGQSRMGLQSADGFTAFPPAPRGSCRNKGPRQTAYADEHNGVVAWTETTTTNLYRFDWCVFAHHPKTGRTTLLGDSHALTGGEPMPEAQDGSGLSVGTDTVYWATAHPLPGKDDFGTSIVAAPLNGRAPGFRTVMKRAKLPQALGKSLFYVKSADVTPGLRKDRFEIHRLDADETDTIVAHGALKPGQSVSALAVSEGRITWTIATPGKLSGVLYSLDLRTNRALAVELGHSGPATMVLRATDRFLAWANGSDEGDAGQYLYDRARSRLWKLGSQPGYSVAYAAGDYVAWARLSKPKRGPGTSTYTVARWK